MEELRNAYKILIEQPEGKEHSEDVSIDGKIKLE
jgi:hypothetical protein